jgi:YHS domain-containing protein
MRTANFWPTADVARSSAWESQPEWWAIKASNSKGVPMQTKKCPVCGNEIKGAGVQAKIGGKEVTVCCSQCAKEAQEHPAQYAGAVK